MVASGILGFVSDRRRVENVCSSSEEKKIGKIQELEEKLEQVTKERNKYKRKYPRLLQQIANKTAMRGDSGGCCHKTLTSR